MNMGSRPFKEGLFLNTCFSGYCCSFRNDLLDLLQTLAEKYLSWLHTKVPEISGYQWLSWLYFLIQVGVRGSQSDLSRTMSYCFKCNPLSFLPFYLLG